MYPSVITVLPSEDYNLTIEFDNGEKGDLDMTPFLNLGVFQRLKSPEAFARVRVAFDTIEWASGVDLDPEFVYSRCKRQAAP